MRARSSLLVALVLPLIAVAHAVPAPPTETDVRVLVREAEEAVRSGDWEKALTAANAVLKAAPDDPDALEIAGSIHVGTGSFDEGETMIARACALRPERAECFVRLGRAQTAHAVDCTQRRVADCRLAASDRALVSFREALRRDPESVGARRGIALALSAAGRAEESIEAYEAWIAAAPGDLEAGVSLANALAAAERWDELSSLAERFSERDPEMAGTVGLRALGHLYEFGRRAKGDVLLDRLRAIDVSESRQRGLRAIHLALHRSYDRALDELARYLASGPPTDEAQVVYNAVVDRGPKMKGMKLDPLEDEIRNESSRGLILPQLAHKTRPYYPEALRRQRIEGTAILKALIRTDGTIGRLTLLSATHPAFAVAALDTAKQWRYEPATEDGKPVAMYYTIRVDFRLR